MYHPPGPAFPCTRSAVRKATRRAHERRFRWGNGDRCQAGLDERAARRGANALIREDRELLAELARVNGDMASLGMRIIEGSASAGEQQQYAQRLIAVGERLRRRADGMGDVVFEGEVLADKVIALPAYTVEPDRKP